MLATECVEVVASNPGGIATWVSMGAAVVATGTAIWAQINARKGLASANRQLGVMREQFEVERAQASEQILVMKGQLALSQEQAQNAARPYVIAEVVPGLTGIGTWDLVLRNVGKMVARRVIGETDVIPKRSDKDYISESLTQFLATPRDIGPDSRVRVFWRTERLGEPDNQLELEAGAPPMMEMKVRYEDIHGNPLDGDFMLDIRAMGQAAPAPGTGQKSQRTTQTFGRAAGDYTKVDDGSNDIALKNIENVLRSIAAHVAELRR